MPPKASAAGTKGGHDAPVSVESVGVLFQQVQRSAAHAQRCRRALVSLAAADEEGLVNAVCAVELLILKQTAQLTSDALRRHYAFLTDVCRACREHGASDALPVAMMRQMLGLHNASDKLVRLAVVTTFEMLLKTVDQSNTSEERQDFYQEVAEMLKQRVHDRCPMVREKAVAAVAAFQTGKKNCDVTQQLIAVLCVDSSADVRRQVLRSIAPRKEFLEGYFHGMVRSVRDTVARVRAEAWDALGRFPWRYITAYAAAKAIRLPELMSQGLLDSNTSVVIACRAALTNCWLHRDCRDECGTMLDAIACGYVLPSLEPFDRISGELLAYVQRRSPEKHFPLNLDDINTSSLLMWKADCLVMSEREGEDETELLLPLAKFAAVLQDTVYAYARPDAPPKTVKFRNAEDADNMLRLLLSVFDVYEGNGYLAHADNTTRISLLRLLNFLLKVVPDDDPALFVDVAVRSLKALTRRTPEEATKTVTSALDSLFRSLKLPQRYALGFEDVEALGRKSRERQQDLARRMALLRCGDVSQEEVDALRAEMDRDEKFLLRMQLMVLAFLSHSSRGDAVPAFCSHVIQLGRQQDNERVRVAATQSLGLQCLVSADTVYTFAPLILADAREGVGAREEDEVAVSVPVAAIGVLFDLVMEYGLRFFDGGSGPSGTGSARPSTTTTAAAVAAMGAATGARDDADLEARLLREQELAEEDVHKIGSRNLLATLQSFLGPDTSATNTIAIVGFCKLLSCNRVPAESAPLVVAELLCHLARVQQVRKDGGGTPVAAYVHDVLDKFFRSYAASHPKRQAFVAVGGVAAFHTLLQRNTAVAARLMDYVTRCCDAFTLAQVRDIDPEAARRASNSSGAVGAEPAVEVDAAGAASARTAAARSSMQSGRLLRELSRYSLHERIAEGVLAGLATRAADSTAEQWQACVEVLERRMYFYSKEPQPLLLLSAGRAIAALEACEGASAGEPPLLDRLRRWASDVEARGGGVVPGAAATEGRSSSGYACEAAELAARYDALCEQQEGYQRRLRANGFPDLDGIPPQPSSHGSASRIAVKVEDGDVRTPADRKRERMESLFLDIATSTGSRRRPRL